MSTNVDGIGAGKSCTDSSTVYRVTDSKSKSTNNHFVSEQVKAMVCRDGRLTAWETEFIDSILDYFDTCDDFGLEHELSDKQRAVLERIYCKVERRA